VWRDVPVQTATAGEGWWHAVGDETLHALVAEAQRQNMDVRIAATRVLQARSLVAEASAETRPRVDAGVRGDRRRYPPLLYPGFDQPAPASTTTLFFGSIDAAFEIDLFGRLAKGVSRAQDELHASESDVRTVRLAVIRDLVAAYAEARTAQERIRLAVEVESTAARLNEAEGRLVRAGLTTTRDTRQAQDLIGTATAAAASAERDYSLAITRLALLLGKTPVELSLPPTSWAVDPTRLTIAADLPAKVVERRPDVQAAWLRLSAATTDIERARLERYPRITLTGALGFASNELNVWLVRNALAWALGAIGSMPLIDGGRVDARTSFAKAVRDEYAIAYRRTVVAALADVEQALAEWQAASAVAEERADALVRRRLDLDATNRAIIAGRTDERQRIRDRLAMLEAKRMQAEATLQRVLAYAAVHHALGR
jgi:multidrug efflux system outer membrane protein